MVTPAFGSGQQLIADFGVSSNCRGDSVLAQDIGMGCLKTSA
jgi:hypothetical protein